jgi:ribosomal protein S20
MHTKKMPRQSLAGQKNEILVFLQNIGKIIDMAVKKGV